MKKEQPKKVDTAFVLSELRKIKDGIQALDDKTDMLYVSVLFEEAVEFVKTCKTVTSEKLMKKFSIGYAKSARLVDMLVDADLIQKDENQLEKRGYKVIK